jgi:aminopeptidase N
LHTSAIRRTLLTYYATVVLGFLAVALGVCEKMINFYETYYKVPLVLE